MSSYCLLAENSYVKMVSYAGVAEVLVGGLVSLCMEGGGGYSMGV